MKKLNQIEITRFIASVIVVIFHYGRQYYPFNVEPWQRISTGGPVVVPYFFVLSGFVLTYVYSPREEGKKINKQRFWVNRLSRFYPLYFAALILVVPFRWGNSEYTLVGLVLEVFMLQPWVPGIGKSFNGPDWAMSVMMFFYILFPFIMPWMQRKGLRFSTWFTALFWLMSQIMMFSLYCGWESFGFSFSKAFLFYFPLLHLNSFLIGILAGLYYKQGGGQTGFDALKNRRWLIGMAVFSTAFFYYRYEIGSMFGVTELFNTGLMSPLYAFFIYFLARDTTAVSTFLSKKWLVKLGGLSFTVYLLQGPVVQVYQTFILERLEHHFPWTEAVHFYFYLVMLFGVAAVVQHLFEKPIQSWIRKGYQRLATS